MKTNIDWKCFDSQDEVEALACYIAEEWTGLTLEASRNIAQMGFMHGWISYGEHYDYLRHENEYISGIEIAMEREKKLEDLGYSSEQIYQDGVCLILLCFDSLARHQGPESDFDDYYPQLVLNAKEEFGQTLLDARPNGWGKKRLGQTLRGATQQQYDKFDGCRTINPCGPKFVDEIDHDNVKDRLKTHDLQPYETLLKALYTHAVLVRKSFNENRMGAYLASIDANQAYAAPGRKVKVGDYKTFRDLLEKAASTTKRAKDALAVIEWDSLLPQPTQAPSL